LLALKVIFSLTTGSMLSMWFAELITKENLGNGSSMIIFINIIGGLPANIREFSINLQNSSLLNNFFTVFSSYLVYLIIVGITVLVQESYMKIDIISARQLNYNYLEKSSAKDSKLNNSYIPIKLNQGGIMPLVFSTTIATFLLSPLQMILSKISIVERTQLTSLLTLSSFILNLFLIVFFSNFLSLLVLKPKDLSENLTKMAYSVPGIKPGKDTIQYLEKIISRLAFMGGIFLAFLAFFPVLVSNIFEFNLFKNITSLIIMVGVVTDVTSRVKGYLISQNYESLKEA
jgi:preprotein translocase subunit SecY